MEILTVEAPPFHILPPDSGPAPEPEQDFGLRFPRRARLLRRADFDAVYRKGRRHFSANLTLFWLPRAADPCAPAGARFGFTVGRVLGGAVARNRIRRRLREAVRLNRSLLRAPVDVVINPKKSALNAPFAELSREVADALRAVASGKSSKLPRPRA
ncbi:MAG TPA: ribonuclease P protein component [Terriglobales bacterium]|nr:ribonuclease P protein component [Terriglobales bacterium]